MKPWQTIFFSAVVAALVAFGLTFGLKRNAPAAPIASSAYERIISSKSVRCGYIQNPPFFVKDPNTGAVSGLAADILRDGLGQAGFKLEFVEEVGWGTAIPGLQAGRYDVLCSAIWRNSARAQAAEFTTPVFFAGIGGYVRADDTRFDGAAPGAAINQPQVRIATIDGEVSSIIADQDFPSASRVALPQSLDLAQTLLNVADHKADIAFVEPLVAGKFLKSHPGSLRNIFARSPVRIYPVTFMVGKNELALKGFLDAVIEEAIDSGAIDRLVRKYNMTEFIYPAARGYQVPQADTGR